MDSIMYNPNDHNTAFACCGEKFLFKKPLNYSHTTFLTLCQDKFKLELTDTNLVNFWVGYRKLNNQYFKNLYYFIKNIL